MNPFHKKHSASIRGSLSCFDRVVFKGHLRALMYGAGVENHLMRKGVLIKDFASHAQKLSKQIDDYAKHLAAQAGRPCEYLPSYKIRKDDRAAQIAKRDNISTGLAAVFRVVEGAQSFRVASGEGRPQLMNSTRKCLCIYFYFMDPDFGMLHVRLQTWLPFTIQVCLNGHEWLRRQLDREGITYQMAENSFTSIDNWERAQEIANRFVEVDWPEQLARWAKRINPLLGSSDLGAMGYYWVCDQAEYATDIAFVDRHALEPLYQNLLQHAVLHLGGRDVMGFLGRKLNGTYQGELVSELKDRWYGRRVKHRAKRNWIKMYDKQGLVLRVETVINMPYEFKVWRKGKRKGERVTGWFPLCKGVGYLYRFAEVARGANLRYLQALSVVESPAETCRLVHEATRKIKKNGRSYAGFNPAEKKDRRLFRAVLEAKGVLHGFSNAEVCSSIYGHKQRRKRETKRLRARISRDLKRLHVHGLIRKVQHSRKWRVTKRGYAVMSMFLNCHDVLYHEELMKLAA